MNLLLNNSAFKNIKFFDNDLNLSCEDVEICSRNLLKKVPRNKNTKQQGICILMSRNPYYIASVFASWNAGYFVIPLNTAWPLEKNLNIINRVKPSAVLVDDDIDLGKGIPALNKSQLFNSNCSDTSLRTEFRMRSLRESDIAYIIFTSGSTGEPKGVVISVGAFRSYIDWTRRYFNSHKNSKRLLLTSELTFDITMGDIAFALAFGTDIGVAKFNTNIPSVLAMIMMHQIDVLYSVPSTHQSLIAFAKQKKGANISSLKLILSGGDRFPWKLVKDYMNLCSKAHFYNVYGPTEVTINCFSIRLDNKLNLEKEGNPVPIGICFDSLNFSLINEEGSTDSEGELCVGGPQIMIGYHEDKLLTKKSFIEYNSLTSSKIKVYRTGDLAYTKDGLIYLKGRIDGLVKIRGYRIHPDEISKTIDLIPDTEMNTVVHFLCDNELELAAFIKVKKSSSLNNQQVIEYLRKKIPSYMIPKKIIFVDAFPLNQSGKIDSSKLKKLL